MAALPDRTAAVLGLCSRLADAGDVTPLKAREYWELVDRVGDVSVLLGRTPDDLTAGGIQAEEASRYARLLGRGVSLALAMETLQQDGIWTIAEGDEGYPDRLRRLSVQAPPFVHGAGSTALLDVPTLGVVGSRNVDESGAEVARSAARAAVERGWTVVSGGARGVDQLAMGAAIDAGGRTVGVLAESLTKRLREAEVRRSVHDDVLCLLTPYKPSVGFNVANAMGRNKLIYALSDITLVVATDEGTGGTWAGATEALRKNWGDVAVWRSAGEGPGNEGLAAKGARAVEQIAEVFEQRLTGEPDLADQLGFDF